MSKEEVVSGKILSRRIEDGRLIFEVEVPKTFKPERDDVFFLSEAKEKTYRQLNFFYAICTDIGKYMGETQEEVKSIFKRNLNIDTLSDVSIKEMASLINYAIEFCKKNEITLSEKTVQQMDADKHIDICKHFKSCLICGKGYMGEHHVDVIGMGRDRDKVDKEFPEAKKLPLCWEHHSELEQISTSKFLEKYHLQDYKIYFERSIYA